MLPALQQSPQWDPQPRRSTRVTAAAPKPFAIRRLGLALGLMLTLAPLATSLSACQRQPPPPPPASGPRRISALGRIEPETRVRRVSVPSSLNADRIQEILVQEGDTVKKGQPLAVLNSRGTLAAGLAEAEASVLVAQRKLEQVKAGAKKGEIQAQVFKVESLEREYRAQKLAQDQSVNAKQATLREAQTEKRRYEELYAAGGASQLERDRYRTRAETSQAELSKAIETRAGTLATLSSQIAAERQTLAKIREIRPEDVATAQSELLKARASRERAKQELAYATVEAPQAGRILKILVQPGDRVGEQGILEMADTTSMVVTAEVYQTDMPGIRLGQQATITADGFQGQARATAYQILPQVQRQSIFAGVPGENQDLRVIQVRLRIDPQSLQKHSISSATNLQVNVLFDPLTPQQLQRPLGEQ